ncbi:diguanylate cyclase domain-containing protein [Frateuria soli]|uniref:diguanylate cyclase domain-containing protein n=1 Tax=Frateuria soli TaxID=1542730 RepID=UPI001E5C9DE1|nr:diguanylate cyclase [Frateuria soli]UGB37961.1 diguanylate cyclase [Frateuria soli]
MRNRRQAGEKARRATGPALAVASRSSARRYGHIYGDQVILLLAQQMRASFRQGDMLFRVGGEEFVTLLAGHDQAEARQAPERFRERVAITRFRRSAT